MKNILYTLALLVSLSSFGQEPFEGLSFNSLKDAFDYIDKKGAIEYEGIWSYIRVFKGEKSKSGYQVVLLKNGNDYYSFSINDNAINDPSNYKSIKFSVNNSKILSVPQSKLPPPGLGIEGEYSNEEDRKKYLNMAYSLYKEFHPSYTYSKDYFAKSKLYIENMKKAFNYGEGQIIKIINKVEEINLNELKFIETSYYQNGDKEDLIHILERIYPENLQKSIPKNKWAGNGSGIIISKSGYIVTNNHVIEDADNIEIEVMSDGEIQKFNAEVIQKDLRNDLAILKIVDLNFDGFGTINYNFKTRSSDVGTKIYTFGYPKALSGMGKEVKVTEGIISSKSGIMGDITTYQITAPIQGGNSGGPLFDDKGNLIGINSSKFNSNETENVNYSIKSSYLLNLIDVLPKSIDLPSSTKLQSLPLTEQIKEISKYVVLVKVK